jgi:hypothetical protein
MFGWGHQFLGHHAYLDREEPPELQIALDWPHAENNGNHNSKHQLSMVSPEFRIIDNHGKESIMTGDKEKTQLVSRRSMVKGSAIFLLGAAAGRISNAHTASAAAPSTENAPPLPWPWVKLDPMEAGRLAYRSYLEKKG